MEGLVRLGRAGLAREDAGQRDGAHAAAVGRDAEARGADSVARSDERDEPVRGGRPADDRPVDRVPAQGRPAAERDGVHAAVRVEQQEAPRPRPEAGDDALADVDPPRDAAAGEVENGEPAVVPEDGDPAAGG